MKIDEIEAEVFCIILEYVCNTSHSTVKSLLLVNRYFQGTVRTISHCYQKFTLSGTVQRSLDKQWSLQTPIVLQNVRHLTVVNRGSWETNFEPSSPQSYNDFLRRFEPFNEYIRSLKSLQTLIWNAGPIPESLLSTLIESHPRATLKVLNFARFHPHLEGLHRSELALSNSSSLTHFRFVGRSNILQPDTLSQGIHHSRLYNYRTFLAMISRAQNLEYAGFISHALEPRETGEDCVSEGTASSCIQSLTLDAQYFVFDRDMLTHLGKHIDLRKVETLKFSRGVPSIEYFQNAADFFTNLRHVSLSLTTLRFTTTQEQDDILSSIRHYIMQSAPLRTLSVWSWNKAILLEDVLLRHGAELKTLQLHEKSDRYISHAREAEEDTRRVLSATELKAIRCSCPNLVDLTVDLTCEGETFALNDQPDLCAKLDELALFEPPLRVIRLYYSEASIYNQFHSQDTVLDHEDSTTENDNFQEETMQAVQDEDADADVRVEQIELHADSSVARDESEHMAAVETKDSPGAYSEEDAKLDPDQILENYVASIWKRVYAKRSTGEHCLEVKFGEWESQEVRIVWEDLRRYYNITSHERDDMAGECRVRCYQKDRRE